MKHLLLNIMFSLRGKICETIILSWISNESIVSEVPAKSFMHRFMGEFTRIRPWTGAVSKKDHGMVTCKISRFADQIEFFAQLRK